MREIVPIRVTVHDTRISKYDLVGRPDRKVSEIVLEFYDKDFLEDESPENKVRFQETLISVSLAALRAAIKVRFVPWTVTQAFMRDLETSLSAKVKEKYEPEDLFWYAENYSETLYGLADSLEVFFSQMKIDNLSIKIEQGDYCGRLTETTKSVALDWHET
jgi:hypothetical protein